MEKIKNKSLSLAVCFFLLFGLLVPGCGNAAISGSGDAAGVIDETGESGVMSTCTLSITCQKLVENPESLDEAKKDFVPEDGVILPETEYEISEGDTVFDILQRACLENDIAMEYSSSAVYETAYIEGINQLYEFDAGSQSGWLYSVNGEYPNYGCSKYEVCDGDEIEWIYTISGAE